MHVFIKKKKRKNVEFWAKRQKKKAVGSFEKKEKRSQAGAMICIPKDLRGQSSDS